MWPETSMEIKEFVSDIIFSEVSFVQVLEEF
jgi:hypothetical protein